MKKLISNLIKEYKIDITLSEIIKMYSEPHRYYHTMEHVIDLIRKIMNLDLSIKEKEILFLSSVFHDIIYVVGSSDNEKKSAEFFVNRCNEETSDIKMVYNIIIDTKTHVPRNYLSDIFCDLDMYNLYYGNLEDLIRDEYNIYKEFYPKYGDKYVEGRLIFLKDVLKTEKGKKNSKTLNKYIEYIKRKYKL